MSGRYGVSSSSPIVPPSEWPRGRRAGTTLLGCGALVAAGVLGIASSGGTPETPGGGYASVAMADRDSGQSRSGERSGVPTTSQPQPSPTVSESPTSAPPDPDAKPVADTPLPASSGSGRRVVFDITGQQVWLVKADNTVARTYKVSGSRYDQVPEGTFEVFSTSRHAVSWHGTETMEYMVRFYRGENSNIGFHDIPVETASGTEVQKLSQLGAPRSDGCVRQDVDDAVALWGFAPVGTPVVVVRT